MICTVHIVLSVEHHDTWYIGYSKYIQLGLNDITGEIGKCSSNIRYIYTVSLRFTGIQMIVCNSAGVRSL